MNILFGLLVTANKTDFRRNCSLLASPPLEEYSMGWIVAIAYNFLS